MLLCFRYFSFRIKARVKRNLATPPHLFSCLSDCAETSHFIFSGPWTGIYIINSPGSQAFGFRLNFPFLGLQFADGRQIMGLFSLHNLVSRFLLLTFSSLSLSLWKPPFYSLLLWVWLYQIPHKNACLHAKSLSHVWLFATLWTAALQAPLSVGIIQGRFLEWVALSFLRGSSSHINEITQYLSLLSGLFHLAKYFPSSSILWMARVSFLKAEQYSMTYMYSTYNVS